MTLPQRIYRNPASEPWVPAERANITPRLLALGPALDAACEAFHAAEAALAEPPHSLEAARVLRVRLARYAAAMRALTAARNEWEGRQAVREVEDEEED